MQRSIFTRTFATATVVAGLAILAAAPAPAGARASVYHLQTQVNGRPVIYHDAFSPGGLHATDAQLGYKTHWEGLEDLSVPTSPIEWTRVKDIAATAPGASAGHIADLLSPTAPGQIRSGHGSRDGLTSSTCDNPGGVKLWYATTESGDCIRYTGHGFQNLAGVNYPYGPANEYVDHSKAFSSLGSTGYGHLACRQDWSYTNNRDYGNLFVASNNLCDGTNGNVNVLYAV